MPLSFIPTMHRSLAEKTVLFVLLTAGLGATVAAMVRAITLLGFYGQYAIAWLNVKTDLLSSTEMFLGVIAANLPCLKGPTHRLLIRIGVMGSSGPSGASPSSFIYRLSQGNHFGVQLFQLATSKGEDKELSHWSSGDRLRVPEAVTVAAHRPGSWEEGDLHLPSGR